MSINSKFNETEVIGLLAKGDRRAFRMVFDRYQAQVFATVLSILKTREQARKIVEKVFVDVWEERSSFRQIQYLESYIFTRAGTYTLNSLRRQLNENSQAKHPGKSTLNR
jgi:RNA polymerase sigma-70 factor (ECF subfamily)